MDGKKKNGKWVFTRYANITDEQKEEICAAYKVWRGFGCEPAHALACATGTVFHLPSGRDRTRSRETPKLQ